MGGAHNQQANFMDAQNWQQQNQQGNVMGAQHGQQQNQQGDFMGAQNQQGNFMGAQNMQQQHQQGNFMGTQNQQGNFMGAQNMQQQHQQGNAMGTQNQQGNFMGAQNWQQQHNQQGNFMGAQNWQQQNQQGNFMGAQNWQQQNQQATFPVMNGGIQVQHPEQRHQGEIIKKGEKYGFIKPDDGSPDMFVLPGSCAAFGGMVPEIGTQLTYTIAVEKSGKPVAHDVQPLGYVAPPADNGVQDVYLYTAKAAVELDSTCVDGEVVPCMDAEYLAPMIKEGYVVVKRGMRAGIMDRIGRSGAFGFIKQDSGGENMFVLPGQCPGFPSEHNSSHYILPPVGARLIYSIETDPKTRKPRATDVRPEPVWAANPGQQSAAIADIAPPENLSAAAMQAASTFAPAPTGFSQPPSAPY